MLLGGHPLVESLSQLAVDDIKDRGDIEGYHWNEDYFTRVVEVPRSIEVRVERNAVGLDGKQAVDSVEYRGEEAADGYGLIVSNDFDIDDQLHEPTQYEVEDESYEYLWFYLLNLGGVASHHYHVLHYLSECEFKQRNYQRQNRLQQDYVYEQLSVLTAKLRLREKRLHSQI